MVGEIRDTETADIAINASLTGHRLLSTLHTNDAPTAVPRLIVLGVQPFLIASTLNVIIAQRLARRICASCVHSIKPTKEMTDIFKEQVKGMGLKIEPPQVIYRGEGCNVCGFSGYRGH